MPSLLVVFSSHLAACVLDRYLHVLCIFHREHPTAVRVSALVERYEVGAMSGGLNEDPIVNMQINRLGSKMSVVVAHRRLSVSTPSSIINNNNDQQWQCGDSYLTKCSSSSFGRAANNTKGPLNPLRPSITPLAQEGSNLAASFGPIRVKDVADPAVIRDIADQAVRNWPPKAYTKATTTNSPVATLDGV
jgi:hypothetical protein